MKPSAGPGLTDSPSSEVERVTEEQFLAAIRDSPEDVAARLAFADWLEERGEDGRAAGVRRGCRFRLPVTAKELRHLRPVAEARAAARADDVAIRASPSRPVPATPDRAALAEDLANLSPLEVARNFPRDDKGRFLLGTAVLLAEYTPAVAPPRFRGLWLAAVGPARRSDPQTVRVELQLLIGENQHHTWTNARHYWDRRAAAPPGWGDDPKRARRCTALQDQGRFEEALRLCGVGFPPDLTRLLNAEPVRLPNTWRTDDRLAEARGSKLRRALWEAAPWRFARAIERQRRHRPSGIGDGRLFIFPGSTASRRPDLRLSEDADGRPHLGFAATASNVVMPETDWKRPVELDLERFAAGRPGRLA